MINFEKYHNSNTTENGDYETEAEPEIVQEEPDINYETQNVVDDGETILRHLEELPKEYHVSAEHKALFGTLEEKEDTSGFPIILRQRAVFTALGLEYGDKRIPYKREFCQELHENIFQNLMDEAYDTEDENTSLDERLGNEDEVWKDSLSKLFKKRLLELQRNEYSNLISILIQKGKSFPSSRRTEYKKECEQRFGDEWDKEKRGEIETGFRKKGINKESEIKELLKKSREDYIDEKYKTKKEFDIKKFALENNLMTEDEYNSYHNYKTFKKNIINEIVKICKNNDTDKKFSGRITELRDRISDYLRISTYNEVEASDMEETDKNEIFNRIVLSNGQKNENGNNLLKQMLEEFPEIVEQQEIWNRFKELKSVTRNYYMNTLLKRIQAEKKFFSLSEKDMLREEERVLKEEKKNLEGSPLLQELLINEIEKHKKLIADIAFPDKDEEIEDVFILSTGVVVLDSKGEYKTSAISPLDEKVLNTFDNTDERDCWAGAWKKNQGRNDAAARNLLEGIINNNKTSHEDSFDRELSDYLNNNDIEGPKIFDHNDGRVYDSMQRKDYELLKKLTTQYGDFIKGVDLGYTGKEINLTNTRLEITGYLSGDKNGNELLLVSGNCKMKLREIESLFHNTVPEKMQKLSARISAELGISLYESLSSKNRESFSDIIGPNINISEVEFYKLFHKKTPSAAERRVLIKRSLFLREFNKYLSGKSEGRMKTFFEEIGKKPQLA